MEGPERMRGSGEGLWSEVNTRRLLQAAVPAPEPDAAVLARVERRLISGFPDAAVPGRLTTARPFRVSLSAAVMAYGALLAAAAFAGGLLRPAPMMPPSAAAQYAPRTAPGAAAVINYAPPPITGASVVSLPTGSSIARQPPAETWKTLAAAAGTGTPEPGANETPARKDLP